MQKCDDQMKKQIQQKKNEEQQQQQNKWKKKKKRQPYAAVLYWIQWKKGKKPWKEPVLWMFVITPNSCRELFFMWCVRIPNTCVKHFCFVFDLVSFLLFRSSYLFFFKRLLHLSHHIIFFVVFC